MTEKSKRPMTEFDRALFAASTDFIILLVPLMIFLFIAISKSVIYFH